MSFDHLSFIKKKKSVNKRRFELTNSFDVPKQIQIHLSNKQALNKTVIIKMNGCLFFF